MSNYDKKYAEFEEHLYAVTSKSEMYEEKVENLFAELLGVLPNNGKLYKYKSLRTFHIDELTDKYVWLSSAQKLNDNKDCAFNANSFEQMEKLIQYFLTDDNFRKFLVKGVFFELSSHNNEITIELVDDCIRCALKQDKKIGKKMFKDFCYKYKLSSEQKEKLEKTILTCKKEQFSEQEIRRAISNFHKQMQDIRKFTQVCSLTTSYAKDSMWAYYCNNKGICLEYDFNNITNINYKKLFVNTQKVKYGKKKKFSYKDVLSAHISNTSADLIKADKMTIEQFLTKDKSWSTEEEWRTICYAKDNEIGIRAFVDIISAIYIDYSIIKYKKARQIIKWAKENNRKIYVRYFDEYDAEYRYDTIENIKSLIARTKKLIN